MVTTKMILRICAAASLLFSLSACSPEIGSEEWCADMKEKPKGEWTANEASEYAKSCLF